MVDDVEFMDGVQLKAEVKRLRQETQEVRQITQEWLDQQGHNRCWYYPELFSRLADKLGLTITVDPALPPRPEFEEGCRRYQNEEYGENEKGQRRWVHWAMGIILAAQAAFFLYLFLFK